jgi:hypothetical protein
MTTRKSDEEPLFDVEEVVVVVDAAKKKWLFVKSM